MLGFLQSRCNMFYLPKETNIDIPEESNISTMRNERNCFTIIKKEMKK